MTRTLRPRPVALRRKATGAGKPRTNDRQLRLLRRWAFAFAVVVPSASVPAVLVGFQLSPLLVVPLAIALMGGLWFANRRTVTVMKEHDSSMPPRFRVVLSIAGALIIACATMFWVFDRDIETARAEADPAKWDAEAQSMRAEKDKYREILDRKPVVIEQDLEVLRLQRELDAKKAEIKEAEDKRIGELDGTSGTRVPGKDGDAYREKEKRSNQLQHEKTDLDQRLETRRAALRDQNEQLPKDQEQARRHDSDIDKRLAALGPRPTWSGRIRALFTAAGSQRPLTVIWFAAAVAAFVVVDCLGLLFVVRRICRPAQGYAGAIKEKSARQSDSDERRVRGAKWPEEVPHLFPPPTPTEGGD